MFKTQFKFYIKNWKGINFFMLELKNVTKEFGENKAIDDISFKVNDGKIFGLIGRNGARKINNF